MAIKNIDFGTFPDDPSADAIRTAFRKTQENFAELFAAQEDQAVISVNKTTGAGITVNSPTGNVVVSAKIACVQIQSSTLGLGVSSGNTSNTAVITDGTTPFIIDLPETISNIGNIALSGTLTANTVNVNLTINGNVGSFSGNVTAANLNANTGLSVVGNANVGNIGGASGVFTANLSANYFNGIGVILTGNANAANINATLGNFAGNINSLNANLGNLATANFFTGDGGLLTNVQATVASISNGTSNARIATSGGNLLVAVAGNANVMVVSGALVEIVGNLSATGNSNVGNLGTINLIATGNANAINFNGTNVALSSNITAVTGNITGNLSTGNANLGNLATANFFSGDGYLLTNLTISAGSYIINGTSNVSIPSPNSNVEITVAGNANVMVVTGTGANIAGTANVTGNLSAGNISTAGVIGGTLSTGAQPNVTSLGTLTALTVNGVANLGTASNVRLTGGANSQVLTSNGAGGVAWMTATDLDFAPGANTQVIYNDDGNFAASAGMIFTNTSNTLTVTGNMIAGNVYANSGTLGATLLAGTLTTVAQPNITSVGTLTSLIVTGNTNAGNLFSANYSNSKYIGVSTGSLTTSVPAVNAALIWNNASETFTAIKVDATDTNSGAGSLLMDLHTSSVSQFSVAKNGNVTGNFFLGNGSALTGISVAMLANGTSNVDIPAVNGNVNISAAGNANVLQVTGTGANVAGTANITGNSAIATGQTNYLTLTGAATTVSPTITATGSDPNVGLTFTGKGNSIYNFTANGNTSLPMLSIAGGHNTADYLLLTGQSLGNPGITAIGSSTNVNLNLGAKGTGNIVFYTNTSNVSAGGSECFRIVSVENTAVRLQVSGAVSGGDPLITVGSGAADTGLILQTKGAGNLTVQTNSGNTQFAVTNTANAARYLSVTGSVSGNPTLTASAGNIALGTNTEITGNANVSGIANIVGNVLSGNLTTTTAIITTGNITTINSGLLQNGNSNVTITVNANVVLNAVGGERLRLHSTGANITGTANVTGTATLGTGSTNHVTIAGSATNPTIGTSAGNLTFGAKLLLAGNASTFSSLLTNSTEVVTVSATAATGTINFDATTQGVLLYTSNAAANWTMNFRASSGTTLNNSLDNGESVTCVFLATNGATPYYANVTQVDGSNVTPKWQGGTAPSAGNANSIDAYSYTIIKTAANTYTVLGSQTKFA